MTKRTSKLIRTVVAAFLCKGVELLIVPKDDSQPPGEGSVRKELLEDQLSVVHEQKEPQPKKIEVTYPSKSKEEVCYEIYLEQRNLLINNKLQYSLSLDKLLTTVSFACIAFLVGFAKSIKVLKGSSFLVLAIGLFVCSSISTIIAIYCTKLEIDAAYAANDLWDESNYSLDFNNNDKEKLKRKLNQVILTLNHLEVSFIISGLTMSMVFLGYNLL